MAPLEKRVKFRDEWAAKNAWSAVAAISENRSTAVGGRRSVEIILGEYVATEAGKRRQAAK